MAIAAAIFGTTLILWVLWDFIDPFDGIKRRPLGAEEIAAQGQS